MSITTSMIYHRTWIIGAALAAPILPVSSQVPPNLVFIMADQYRGDALGCVGKEPVKTPCHSVRGFCFFKLTPRISCIKLLPRFIN